MKPTRLATRRLDARGSEPAATGPCDRWIASPGSGPGVLAMTVPAIEIEREKRNFDAAAPHWFKRLIHPDPPCFSLLKAFFSLFRAQSSRQSVVKKVCLFR
jgi:hypothetical protein